MHYSQGEMWRPLFEETNAMLQLASGCSHNACKFCTMHNETMFTLSPFEEVTADIEELARASWIRKNRVICIIILAYWRVSESTPSVARRDVV